ncbi:MAG: hypothetical protein OHK0039_16080 [Bacteroidia bacterium]
MNYTYEQIAPLLVEAEVEGSKMFCTFEVPGTGTLVESTASMRRMNTVQGQVTRIVTRSVSREARRMTSRLISNLLGSGFVGRTARSVVNASTRGDLIQHYTEDEKRTAIVDAFARVAGHFQLDAPAGRWQAPAVPPPPRERSAFEEHVHKFPPQSNYDKEILVRMLVELAQADGAMSDEERDFLASFVPPELGRAEDWLHADPLSPIECEEVSKPCKRTLYMIGRALTLIDFEPKASEEALLSEMATMLGLQARDIAEADSQARAYVLESVIDTQTSREELLDLGDRLGMSQDEALRCQIQLKKRG